MNDKATNLVRFLRHRIHMAKLTLRWASVDPSYLFFAITDLSWGLGVLFGTGFHSERAAFYLINTQWFGWILAAIGFLGILNFFYRHFWYAAGHSWFNVFFYIFVATVLWQQGDTSAACRNATCGLLAAWVTWRLQSDNFFDDAAYSLYLKGHER